MVAIGLVLMAFGATSTFWINQTNRYSNSLLVSSNRNAPGTVKIAPTPTAEVYLAAVLPRTAATETQPGQLPTQIAAGKPVPPAKVFRPEWIRIPIIKLDAPIVTVNAASLTVNGDLYEVWQAPDEFAAGWHSSSAPLGVPGNTVLNGHNNIYGEVFRRLADLKVGDRIQVGSGSMVFVYRISNKMTLEEYQQSLATRLEHARWLQPTEDERLTLVTCWPYWSNQYRLVLVARPIDRYEDPHFQN
jgi:sortase A